MNVNDPITNVPFTLTVFLAILVKVLIVFFFVVISVVIYIWFMRKIIADMQNRIGPSKAGPFGVLQSIADGTKLFFKEPIIPKNANRFLFKAAPYFAVIPAFLAFSIVPIGGEVSIFGHKTYLQLAELPMGILWLLMASGIGLYGVLLAGWGSGSKYPLLGSLRASAQLLSYEAALGLSIIGVLIWSNTLSTRGIVDFQATNGWLILSVLPFFVIFLISAIAELNHPPFDLVEAEQELVGGFQTEYSGMNFAMFYLAEFMNLVTMSAITVTLFLGGPNGPSLGFLSSSSVVNVWIMPLFWFLLKLSVLLFGTVWVRASLPRLRYDQLMKLSWKYLIETSFVLVMIYSIIRVGLENRWSFIADSTVITLFFTTTIATAAGLLILWFFKQCGKPKNPSKVN
jgi:NADH-quinone oxidoreductase subunit H